MFVDAAPQYVELLAVSGATGKVVIAAAAPTFTDTHILVARESKSEQTSVGILVTVSVKFDVAP